MAHDETIHLTDSDEAAFQTLGITPKDGLRLYVQQTVAGALSNRLILAQSRLGKIPEPQRSVILTNYVAAIDQAAPPDPIPLPPVIVP